MKRIIFRYQLSKFRRFVNGLLFAVIALIALGLCEIGISANQDQPVIFLYFAIAILSMTMGFISMFHEKKKAKHVVGLNIRS